MSFSEVPLTHLLRRSIAHAASCDIEMANRGGSFNDVAIPTGNIRFVSGQYGGWRIDPLVPKSTLDRITSGEIGNAMTVLFPLQIEDVVNDYLFIFEIIPSANN